MAGGSDLQSLEASPANARCENAATVAVVVVDCKKWRRENMAVPQMSAVHYCMLAEFQIANIAEASWGSESTPQSQKVTVANFYITHREHLAKRNAPPSNEAMGR
jgi:hypothetical protein